MNQMTSVQPDRLEPHNIEAEQQILGALLISNERMHSISGLVSDASFYDPVHQRIFARIAARVDAGQLASPITLKTDLEADEGLHELGGPRYLTRLAGAAISPSHVREYALVVADLAAKRDLLAAMESVREKIDGGVAGVVEIAGELETASGRVGSTTSTKPLIRSHLSALTGAVEQINDAFVGDKAVGVSTGIPALDRKLSYLRPGNLIVLAGRPAMGKSTVAQNIAFSAAEAGVGVFMASLEMTAEECATRLLARGLADHGQRIAYSRMIRGELNEDEMRAVVEEAKRQQALPLTIGERDVRDVGRFRSAVKRAQQQMADSACPLGLVIVDYVQQMHAKEGRSPYERASAASDACKSLAMELGVPVIACAQLSRAVEMREPQIPQLSDLRETGKLEEDADAVIFCYREAYYLRKKIETDDGADIDRLADLKARLAHVEDSLSLIIAKQRSGQEGLVPAYVDLACCRVTGDRASNAEALI